MAHKHVLKMNVSELYEFVLSEFSSHTNGTRNDVDTIEIELPNVDEFSFETMMTFIYTGNEPKLDDMDSAKSILLLADRFGCTELKLFSKSTLVGKFLVPSAAANLMLLAEAHSCALLKEASMDVYVSCPTEVVNSDDWTLVEESPKLLVELVRYMGIGFHQRSTRTDITNDSMGVSSLRVWLEDRGLDLDGTRETLVERWKEHQSK